MAKVSKDSLLSAYLLVGTDELKRQHSLSRLKDYLNPDFFDFNFEEHLDASALEPTPCLDALQQLPFGDTRKLFVIHQVEKLKKETSEALVSYLYNPNPASILLCIADALPKNTRLYKAIAHCGKQAIIDCKTKQYAALVKEIQVLVRNHGLSITTSAARLLQARLGDSMLMLDNQIVSLAQRFGTGYCLEDADITTYVPQLVEANIWNFLDVLSKRNRAEALSLFSTIKPSSYILMHIRIVARLRELICTKTLQQTHEEYRLPELLHRQAWQVEKYHGFASLFSEQELLDCLARAKQLEWYLKNTADKQQACVRFIVAMTKSK